MLRPWLKIVKIDLGYRTTCAVWKASAQSSSSVCQGKIYISRVKSISRGKTQDIHNWRPFVDHIWNTPQLKRIPTSWCKSSLVLFLFFGFTCDLFVKEVFAVKYFLLEAPIEKKVSHKTYSDAVCYCCRKRAMLILRYWVLILWPVTRNGSPPTSQKKRLWNLNLAFVPS